MAIAARGLELANCRAVRGEAGAQFAMDAGTRRCLQSQACSTWENHDGAEIVHAAVEGGSVGHHAGNRPSDARGV